MPKQPFPGLFIDHPELICAPGSGWKYGIEGILIWQSNLWTTGMAYLIPRIRMKTPCPDDGLRHETRRETALGNDGRFMYPPEIAGNARPPHPVLDLMRTHPLGMLRDGIEDYEYLVILKHALDNPDSALSEEQRARFRKLLEVPAAITVDARTHTRTPQP